jgi:hypothetical protein
MLRALRRFQALAEQCSALHPLEQGHYPFFERIALAPLLSYDPMIQQFHER